MSFPSRCGLLRSAKTWHGQLRWCPGPEMPVITGSRTWLRQSRMTNEGNCTCVMGWADIFRNTCDAKACLTSPLVVPVWRGAARPGPSSHVVAGYRSLLSARVGNISENKSIGISDMFVPTKIQIFASPQPFCCYIVLVKERSRSPDQ